MTPKEIQEIFEKAGGEFYSSPVVLSEKLASIKALIFDWDGVWHDGKKNGQGTSSFSEVDSMGLNMLRFGYYLRNTTIPTTIIITGEQNVTAFDFAEREHLDGVFYKAKDKLKTFQFIKHKYNFNDDEVLFVFDDILDLAMAKICGVGYLINRPGSPLMHKLVNENGWCDYKSYATGSGHGVREVCELTLGLLGVFESAVENRMNFSQTYANYWAQRNTLQTEFYSSEKGDPTLFSRHKTSSQTKPV
jgi:3-deoxy-D-manno-octulosonate 8-phosphate phosphatase (KDO 8-P phosphatase)